MLLLAPEHEQRLEEVRAKWDAETKERRRNGPSIRDMVKSFASLSASSQRQTELKRIRDRKRMQRKRGTNDAITE